MNCSMQTCAQGRKPCTAAACRAPITLPPFVLWIKREIKARSQLLRWYRTNRAHGFNVRRSIVIAWTTTRPIHTSRRTK